MSRPSTYWHLEGRPGKPSEYEITSSRLLTRIERGTEVATTASSWFRRFGHESPLRCRDWEAFSDPRQTTYATYVELQNRQEIYLSSLLDAEAGRRSTTPRSAPWLDQLEGFIPVLRFPVHGLQMITAYLAGMAPSGRLVIAGAFQAADELRRVHALSLMAATLEDDRPGFGRLARTDWQSSPDWQPLRRLLERLLVTYDWGECFTALQLALKPAFDDLMCGSFSVKARHSGDDLVQRLLGSLALDCQWHRGWSRELVRMLTTDDAGNRGVLERWLKTWADPVEDALGPLARLLGVGDPKVGRTLDSSF